MKPAAPVSRMVIAVAWKSMSTGAEDTLRAQKSPKRFLATLVRPGSITSLIFFASKRSSSASAPFFSFRSISSGYSGTRVMKLMVLPSSSSSVAKSSGVVTGGSTMAPSKPTPGA
ncbi:hypothetical protein WR25_10213 [Diploscapter pachys]|uniref:Uncharacterized protein n=1 Tax=Diploscapter pachys TaxID=2018661 RepID=A0A2A2M6E2_9BILA|nr:hypothetical protein WR25_10213 [Diploscapter pachys]